MSQHKILTGRSCAVIGAFIGYFYYLARAHTGPWTSKWDMPTKTKERMSDLPEFAALFTPDSHPALKRD